MKPLGMDKNRVLIYEGDTVLFNEIEYNVHINEIENLIGGLLLIPSERFSSHGWEIRDPEEVEVVNVSDRTNHERYFADLCSVDYMFWYICRLTECENCIANESMCNVDLVFNQWLREPAVKL